MKGRPERQENVSHFSDSLKETTAPENTVKQTVRVSACNQINSMKLLFTKIGSITKVKSS